MSSSTERVGTIAEQKSDQQQIAKLYKNVPTSFEKSVIVKLPYVFYNKGYSAGLGSQTINQFKVNSIYDFDLTGAGHQPLGRDTWASIYNYYRVLETHITTTVTLLDYTTATEYNCLVGGILDITANPPTTNITQWQEAEMAAKHNENTIMTNIDYINHGAEKPKISKHTMKWHPSLLETAVYRETAANPWATVGNDPDYVNYYSVLFGNQGATNRLVEIRVEAMFLVEFRQLNQSLLYTTN